MLLVVALLRGKTRADPTATRNKAVVAPTRQHRQSTHVAEAYAGESTAASPFPRSTAAQAPARWRRDASSASAVRTKLPPPPVSVLVDVTAECKYEIECRKNKYGREMVPCCTSDHCCELQMEEEYREGHSFDYDYKRCWACDGDEKAEGVTCCPRRYCCVAKSAISWTVVKDVSMLYAVSIIFSLSLFRVMKIGKRRRELRRCSASAPAACDTNSQQQAAAPVRPHASEHSSGGFRRTDSGGFVTTIVDVDGPPPSYDELFATGCPGTDGGGGHR